MYEKKDILLNEFSLFDSEMGVLMEAQPTSVLVCLFVRF